MFQKITTGLIVFFYKSPFLSKLITICFTALFFIKGFDFAKSDFNDLASGIASLFYFITMTISLYALIHRRTILYLNLMEYFVANQEEVATDIEIDFFMREAEDGGFKNQLESYLNNLNRKPLIKECMIKCMELSKNNMDMDA